jgi:hypothetical protein
MPAHLSLLQLCLFSGSDFQLLNATQQGSPVGAVAAPFQRDWPGTLVHADGGNLAELKTRTILMLTAARLSCGRG